MAETLRALRAQTVELPDYYLVIDADAMTPTPPPLVLRRTPRRSAIARGPGSFEPTSTSSTRSSTSPRRGGGHRLRSSSTASSTAHPTSGRRRLSDLSGRGAPSASPRRFGGQFGRGATESAAESCGRPRLARPLQRGLSPFSVSTVSTQRILNRVPARSLHATRRRGRRRHTRLGPAGPVVDVVVPVLQRGGDRSRRSIRPAPRLPVDAVPVLVADHDRRQRVDRRHLGIAPAAAPTSSRTSRAVHLDAKGRGLALRTAWIASDADSRRLHGRRPLDRPRRAAPARRAPRVRALRRRDRLAARTRRRRWPAAPKRELISRTYNLILRTVLATRVRDAQCGFKAVRRRRRAAPAARGRGRRLVLRHRAAAARRAQRPAHPRGAGRLDRRPRQPGRTSSTPRSATSAGTARMARTFAAGRRARRPRDRGAASARRRLRPPARDASGSSARVSTAVSLVLFLLLRGALGPVGANAVAVSATFVANTWANARFTPARRAGRAGRSAVRDLRRLARAHERGARRRRCARRRARAPSSSRSPSRGRRRRPSCSRHDRSRAPRAPCADRHRPRPPIVRPEPRTRP